MVTDELFETMRKLADYFNWDLSKREERDDIESGEVWPDDHHAATCLLCTMELETLEADAVKAALDAGEAAGIS